MNKDNWTDLLREKLADEQSPVPDGLWADIERQLDIASPATRKPHVVPLYRWVAAAACVLVLVGVGLSLWNGTADSPVGRAMPSVAMRHSASTETGSSSSASVSSAEEDAPLLAAADADKSVKGTIYNKVENEPVASAEAGHPSASSSPASTEGAENGRVPADTVAVKIPKSKYTGTYPRHESSQMETSMAQLASVKSSRRSGWSTDLYASNMMLGNMSSGVSTSPVLAVMASSVSPEFSDNDIFLSSSMPRYVEDAKEKVDHKVPVSVGVSVKYRLDDRWALSTGLVYTRLRSDFTHQVSGNSIVDEQTLHYVGIPLKAEYRVWSIGNLHTYVAAGGELDKNIKAKVSTDGVESDMRKDRLQWSADAGVGVQYDIMSQLGVYVEPGVKYYFNNHSQLENSFKDKPWNFHLQFGVRWNINYH